MRKIRLVEEAETELWNQVSYYEETIRVWAIAGTSQKPNYWSDRMR